MGRLSSYLFCACFTCCSFYPSRTAAAPIQKLRVLTSFLPVYCFTANIAAGLAEVENLLPANVEPHDYQFSRKDLQKLSRADLLIVNGLGMENWLEKAYRVQGHPTKVVAIEAGLESELIYSSPEERSKREGATGRNRSEPGMGANRQPNPHIWLDPRLACRASANILSALQKADPANAAGYGSNAAVYVKRLEQLDLELTKSLAPLRGSPLVTFHNAFDYFARRYELKIIGVIEPVPELEPSLKHLAGLYRSIRENGVRAIFTEAGAPSRLARQIARDLGLPLAELETLEIGPMNPAAYEQAIRRNAQVLLAYLSRSYATRPTP
jgi:ABC-type Zn uptake system ZnuABC Zn-binding protein ZnuA